MFQDSEFKVTGGMSIPIDDESKDAEAEVPVNQDLEVEVNNIGDGQEETMKVTEETDVSGTASENISKVRCTVHCIPMFKVHLQTEA